MTDQSLCPCNSGNQYSACCEPPISGSRGADTAEALMRSRYTAYVVRNVDYLLKTWHPSTRPTTIDPATIPEWQGLRIFYTKAGGVADEKGTVEFVATALSHGKALRLHEVSRFVKENGQWFYVDGEIRGENQPATKTPKVGRNEPCPCGSGRKFKKCCGP